MNRIFLKLFSAIALSSVLLYAGCADWSHFAFMNSIPVHGKSSKNPDVFVYLGIDGLSYHSVKEAREKSGIFPQSDWKLGRFVTMFPGTSDASWTRILHTEKMSGAEFEYYDPNSDSIKNKGVLGLARHVMPTFAESINFSARYLDAFDYRANGYSHGLSAYFDTAVSTADTFDNLFMLLDGRAETESRFMAYILEFDVMGHMKSADDISKTLVILAERIESFQRRHPERHFHFTIFSDHGMDFTPVSPDHLVKFDDELKKVGVTPVESLRDHDPARELVAIPIMHTRVSYIGLHTIQSQAEEVAQRTSHLDSVDLAIARMGGSDHEFGIWADGKLAARFNFDAQSDRYTLAAGTDYSRLGMDLSFGSGEKSKSFSDDELFALTRDSKYPDLFYRTRSGLLPVGLEYPCQVLISFKKGFASRGFEVPGKSDIATSGFHGAMEAIASTGTILTQEREIPDSVRSDTLLELFPQIREHMKGRGLMYVEGDRNASLSY